MTYKIGFHCGPGGNRDGIGEYFSQLDAAGIPFHIMSVDDYGPIYDSFRFNSANHVRVFRQHRFSVPNYGSAPSIESEVLWMEVKAALPPEFDRRAWIAIWNEPNKHQSEWMAEVASLVADKAIADGYKTIFFNFSCGEPEPYHWQGPKMTAFIRKVGQNPGKLAIGLHEYSFSLDRILEADPYYLVGRFQQLLDYCFAANIPTPNIFITEFGWRQDLVPDVATASEHLLQANGLYAQYNPVVSAFIWYLGGGFGSIADQAQKLIVPATGQALASPPPASETDEERWWRLGLEEQINHGLQLAPTALQQAIRRDGFHPVTKEMYVSGEPPLMAAEDWNTRTRPRRQYVYESGQVRWFEDPSDPYPPPPPPPEPPPPPPPSGDYDMLDYMLPNQVGNGPLYEVRFPDGSQQRIQTQTVVNNGGSGVFIVTKGTGGIGGKSEWEKLAWDDRFIWRGADTSPGGGRFYVQYETGNQFARWCPRFMSIGQQWTGPGHYVQFFMKETCQRSEPNSGPATNWAVLADHHDALEVNGLVIPDVLEMVSSTGESFYFARGLGMVGWTSNWGSSFISEIHGTGTRPDNEPEPICHFQL